MKTLLVLARGDLKSFHKLDNQSILKDLPFKVVLLVDRGNHKQLQQLEGNFELEVVRWNNNNDIKQIARELHIKHQFCGVATIDESNVLFAAQIREDLGLPGMSVAQTNWFRDKVKMKQKLLEKNIRVPHFTSCENPEKVMSLLKQFGKLVVKPVDGFGSKQVFFITNIQEWNAWLSDNEQDADHYEAEEFIDGALFHVNALVIDGVAKITAPASYLPGMSNVDFTAGTPFVSVILEDTELRQRLVDYSNQINQALELKNGITHMECFLTKNAEIVFCEIGLRPGGGGIVWMIESQYGVNYSQAVLALEAGMPEILPKQLAQTSRIAGLIGMRSNISGFVVETAELSDFSDDCIRLKHLDVNKGAFKAASAHCTDMLGLFIFDSNDTAQFNQNWQKFNKKFQEKLVLNCI